MKFLRLLLVSLLLIVPGLVQAAGGLTDFAENKLIDYIFRAQASGIPSHWYAVLYTTCPTDSTGGSEVSNANNYSRVDIGANALAIWAGTQSAGSTSASSGTGATTSNNNAITFGTASGTWGTINCWGLADSGTYGGGNLWIYGPVSSPPTITNGATPAFAAGTMTFQLDN